MTYPTAEHLTQITAAAEHWLRRCNGYPKQGIPVSGRSLRVVLATSTNVRTKPNGTITWSAEGLQFSAEPIRTENTTTQ